MKQRNDGRWVKKVTLPDGSQKYFYSMAETEIKAEKDIKNQMLSFKEKKEKGLLFKVVAEEWERQKREELPPTTWSKTYNGAFNEIASSFENDYINQIIPNDIVKYFKEKAAQRLSQKSVTTRKNILNMIFNYALVSGYIKQNFISSIKIPSNLPKSKRTMPTDDCVDIIKSNYEGIAFLPYFLLYTGLRISEACALTKEDFDSMSIQINKKITWQGNTPIVVDTTKTPAGTRIVPLINRVAQHMPEFKGYLFSNDGGKNPLTKRALQCKLEKYKSLYSVEFTAHQLRHAFATFAFEAGLEPKEMQEILGHADITTTMNIYTEIRKKQQSKIKAKLNDYDY